MEKSGGGKKDAVCDALESFLSILQKRTGRGAATEGEKPRDGLLVLIRKRKKKAALSASGGAVDADAAAKPSNPGR